MAQAEQAQAQRSSPKPTLLKAVDRISVAAPGPATLGAAKTVTVQLKGTTATPQVSIWQKGEEGHTGLQPTPVVANGNTLKLSVTPQYPGPVMLGVRAVFPDGGVSVEAIELQVKPTAPLSFAADDLPVLALTLNSPGDRAMAHPNAVYPAPVGRIDLNWRFVKYRLVSGQGVIRVDSTGLIRALSPGEAIVEARYGNATARLNVTVRADRQ